jgi:hypothetical protein
MNARAIALLLVLLIFGLIGWVEVVVWGECLEKNSFLYCLRMLNK